MLKTMFRGYKRLVFICKFFMYKTFFVFETLELQKNPCSRPIKQNQIYIHVLHFLSRFFCPWPARDKSVVKTGKAVNFSAPNPPKAHRITRTETLNVTFVLKLPEKRHRITNEPLCHSHFKTHQRSYLLFR